MAGSKPLPKPKQHLKHVDGVMIGREAYHNPYLLAELGQFWNLEAPDRFEIMAQMMPYIAKRMAGRCSTFDYHPSYSRVIPELAGCTKMASGFKWW